MLQRSYHSQYDEVIIELQTLPGLEMHPSGCKSSYYHNPAEAVEDSGLWFEDRHPRCSGCTTASTPGDKCVDNHVHPTNPLPDLSSCQIKSE
jgi:hypothetical protein